MMTKKLLFLCTALSAFSLTNAQQLQSENFNSLTLGNLGTDITGATAGQGGNYTFATNGAVPTTSTNAGNALFQIVSSGNASLGMSITGPNGDKGSSFVWKNGLNTSWAARTVGNNIIEIEVDVFLGPLSTSVNKHGVRVFDAAGTKTLVGFQVNTSTGELQLIAYSTPGANPVGNYSYSIIAAPGVLLPPNAWSRIGVSYNKTTNQCTIKGPGVPANTIVASSAAGLDPAEVDFVVTSGHTVPLPNTAAGTIIFDNLVVRASATDTLLESAAFNSVQDIFANVYPNPVVDFASINLIDAKINAITVMDINGRIVKKGNANEILNAKIDLSDLTAGIYLMTIDTDKGVSTEKIVKK